MQIALSIKHKGKSHYYKYMYEMANSINLLTGALTNSNLTYTIEPPVSDPPKMRRISGRL